MLVVAEEKTWETLQQRYRDSIDIIYAEPVKSYLKSHKVAQRALHDLGACQEIMMAIYALLYRRIDSDSMEKPVMRLVQHKARETGTKSGQSAVDARTEATNVVSGNAQLNRGTTNSALYDTNTHSSNKPLDTEQDFSRPTVDEQQLAALKHAVATAVDNEMLRVAVEGKRKEEELARNNALIAGHPKQIATHDLKIELIRMRNKELEASAKAGSTV